jgi:fructosamine-3-kinase
MFEAEVRGLKLLMDNSAFEIPKPVLVEESGGQQFLVMDWMEDGDCGPDFSREFGRYLAGLHRTTQDSFGLGHSNYIGSLNQSNVKHSTWSEFYWTERLLPQIKLASQSRLMTDNMSAGFLRLESQLATIFPVESAALIHGDLWRGNYAASQEGKPCIFDPALYFGHREMDLAMMHLFGGFEKQVFESYHEVFPLECGWQERISIGQLYPLMVHVNLFGDSYCQAVQNVLDSL